MVAEQQAFKERTAKDKISKDFVEPLAKDALINMEPLELLQAQGLSPKIPRRQQKPDHASSGKPTSVNRCPRVTA